MAIGEDNREDPPDLFPLPPEGVQWEFKPAKKVILIKDSALAATNACDNIWPDTLEATCRVHASIRWFSNNKGLFRDVGGNYSKCQYHINWILKATPHVNLVETVLVKILETWEKK
jgi:hypothetical protein